MHYVSFENKTGFKNFFFAAAFANMHYVSFEIRLVQNFFFAVAFAKCTM